MAIETLIVAREIELHPYYKQRLEEYGFINFEITDFDKDGLKMKIIELKPKLVMIEANFYETATPYMIRCLLDDFPDLNIAIVNIYKFSENKALRFLHYGVNSYVTKFEGIEIFNNGMKMLKNGKRFISPNMTKRIKESGELPPPVSRFTFRENEVFNELITGKKEKDIISIMHISIGTLHKHRERIYRAFGVDNRTELFFAALSAGLV